MELIKNLNFEGDRVVLSIGHRSVIVMLSMNDGRAQMNLSEGAIGARARKGIQELKTWGLVTLTPLLSASEQYELQLTELGRKTAIELRSEL